MLSEILQFKLEPISLNKCHRASIHNGISKGQHQQSAERSHHIMIEKEKFSQKRTRESTILKSKVHLATSGSRVWPVTIFNTVKKHNSVIILLNIE